MEKRRIPCVRRFFILSLFCLFFIKNGAKTTKKRRFFVKKAHDIVNLIITKKPIDFAFFI